MESCVVWRSRTFFVHVRQISKEWFLFSILKNAINSSCSKNIHCETLKNLKKWFFTISDRDSRTMSGRSPAKFLKTWIKDYSLLDRRWEPWCWRTFRSVNPWVWYSFWTNLFSLFEYFQETGAASVIYQNLHIQHIIYGLLLFRFSSDKLNLII